MSLVTDPCVSVSSAVPWAGEAAQRIPDVREWVQAMNDFATAEVDDYSEMNYI